MQVSGITASEMKLYSIVVTFNGEIWISKCIHSLIHSNIQDHEIIIIDNNSTDKTVSIIEDNFLSSVKVIKSKVNLGFGKANNIGIELALQESADYVFLLNQDAWVEEDTIAKLIQEQKKNIQYGLVSPLHLNNQGSLDKLFYTYIRGNHDLISCLAVKMDHNFIAENSFINAATWLLSRNCLLTVGLFNPLFPHYGEDKDYVNRLYFHGFKLGVHLGAFAVHDRDQQITSKYRQSNKKLFKRILISYFGVLLNINENSNQIIRSLFRQVYSNVKNCLIRSRFLAALYSMLILFIMPFYFNKIKESRLKSRKKYVQ
ncbi:MAG: glycosyltransferase family 2 protein [Bacteroidales bacterium]